MPDDSRAPADRLTRLAAPLVADPPGGRVPLDELVRRARARTRRRRAALVAVAALVLVVGVGVVARSGTPDAVVDTAAPPPTTGAPDQVGVIVYLDVTASAEQIQAIHDAVVADPDVGQAVYVDPDQSLGEFRCIFADEPAVTANVTSASLPTSFRLVLVGGPDAADAVVRTYGAMPGVKTVDRGSDARTSGGWSVPTERKPGCVVSGQPVK